MSYCKAKLHKMTNVKLHFEDGTDARHSLILRERQRLVRLGVQTFLDWEVVKRELRMKPSITSFVKRLSARAHLPDSFNPYQKPKLSKNLEHYLKRMLTRFNGVILVGEAPGHLGCRQTGIPFSSEAVIHYSTNPIFSESRSCFFRSGKTEETSARLVWDFLGSSSKLPLLWNAFPFHPHKADSQSTNRKPRRAELKEGRDFLKEICQIFEPAHLIGVGRVGEKALKSLFPNQKVHYVRHPSHGGGPLFTSGLADCFNKFKL